MRAPEHAIPAPPFPGKLPWVNVAPLRMDKQRGRPVLVEFWDFCRVNSLRTLPYLKAWHERYADDGLRVIGVHTGGFLPARETENVVAAVERLGIEYPVVIDERLEIWDFYGNEGWPARYLWDRAGRALLAALRRGRLPGDRARDPGAARRRARARGAACARRTPRASCCRRRPRTSRAPTAGPYEAGGVWAVLEGAGEVTVERRATFAVTRARLLPAGRAPAPHRRACSSWSSAPA